MDRRGPPLSGFAAASEAFEVGGLRAGEGRRKAQPVLPATISDGPARRKDPLLPRTQALRLTRRIGYS